MFDPLYTAEEMKRAEAGHDVGELMARAGRAVAEEAMRRFPDAQRFVAVCGGGANGGDGRIALEVLESAGKIARNAGMSDYRAFVWKENKRFDYTPEDCVRFAETIERIVVPMVDELDHQRAADLKLDKLRPWDFAVDPLSRPPLRPFPESDSEMLVSRTHGIFKRMSEVHFCSPSVHLVRSRDEKVYDPSASERVSWCDFVV